MIVSRVRGGFCWKAPVAFSIAAVGFAFTLLGSPDPVFAEPGCGSTRNTFLAPGACREKATGLAALFTSKPSNNFAPGSREPVGEYADTAMHIVNDERNHLVLRSTNKKLSEFGPDSPARFIVRCTNGSMELLFNFPGYPVSDQKNDRKISYTLDYGETWTANLGPSSELSTLGIWRHKNAVDFLAMISHSRTMHVAALDTDDTQINATFNIEGIGDRTREVCRT